MADAVRNVKDEGLTLTSNMDIIIIIINTELSDSCA